MLAFNAKVTEIKNRKTDTRGLIKKSHYNTKNCKIKNKTSDINDLMKKTYFDTKAT